MNLEELRKFKPQIEAIAEKYGVTNIRVFGSVARGEEREDSDVDFLFSKSRGMSLLTHARFEREISDILNIKVQTISENAVNKNLKNIIFNEAKPI